MGLFYFLTEVASYFPFILESRLFPTHTTIQDLLPFFLIEAFNLVNQNLCSLLSFFKGGLNQRRNTWRRKASPLRIVKTNQPNLWQVIIQLFDNGKDWR
ncbi:Uncharacterised protein [Streptococcus pneumoniae]|nr:Uncharacterised protein [Streptococcus pneumoniae]CIW12341.1 Uncharacterised protein [Streptococcus pneumoniae]CIW24666.1 Uncharacterised protein [Streptococcus pneumoniae]